MREFMCKTVIAEDDSDYESNSDTSWSRIDSRAPNCISNKVDCIISPKKPSIFPIEQ